MAQRVTTSMLEDPCRSDSPLERLLHSIFRKMMPPLLAGPRIDRPVGRWKYVLPTLLLWRARILPLECVGQKDFTITRGQILLVQHSYLLQMAHERMF